MKLDSRPRPCAVVITRPLTLCCAGLSVWCRRLPDQAAAEERGGHSLAGGESEGQGGRIIPHTDEREGQQNH